MKKHLCIILGLMAICGHVHADSPSPDYDYGYPEFVKISKDREEKAISIFNQLIPQNEKNKWTIVYECRSDEMTEIKWFCLDGDQHSWVSVNCCNRGYSDESNTFHRNYFDGYGNYHDFTRPNNFQLIEEIAGGEESKSISLTTWLSDVFFTITYDTDQNEWPRQIDDELVWDAIRELWTQRLLGVQFSIKIENNDSDDSEITNEL